MKATGIVRKVDELGRIVIPKELRKSFNIAEGDPIEIFTDNESIVLKRYEPFCTFCNSSENLITFGGKNVCADCAKKLGSVPEVR